MHTLHFIVLYDIILRFLQSLIKLSIYTQSLEKLKDNIWRPEILGLITSQIFFNGSISTYINIGRHKIKASLFSKKPYIYILFASRIERNTFIYYSHFSYNI